MLAPEAEGTLCLSPLARVELCRARSRWLRCHRHSRAARPSRRPSEALGEIAPDRFENVTHLSSVGGLGGPRRDERAAGALAFNPSESLSETVDDAGQGLAWLGGVAETATPHPAMSRRFHIVPLRFQLADGSLSKNGPEGPF